MPTLFILATGDNELAAAWERQLPQGRTAVRLAAQAFASGPQVSLSAVVVLDAAAEGQLPGTFAKSPTIYVGEPRSVPFEQARIGGRARVYLSYEESLTRLREFLPLLEEVAEKQSMVELLADKARRAEPLRPATRSFAANVGDAAELWDFLEGAVENLDTRDRLIAEFRRASRHLLRASHAVFFLREADGFRADRGTSYFPAGDPMVVFMESHPAVIDGANWDSPADAVAELSIRNRLAMWGARLLVPIHDNGRLLGLIALGVRDDGQPYDESDRTRAVFFARLLRHFLAKSAQLGRLHSLAEQSSLGAKYLPDTLVLGPDEATPRQAPLVVRDLIGRARRSREVCRASPTAEQPFRASAGLIAETGGAWAFWEEASSEVHDALLRQRASRRQLLRELALTLSHELGNALVSLAMFRQTGADQSLPQPLLETVKGDVGKLEALNRHLGLMQSLHEIVLEPVNVTELVQGVGQALGLRVDVPVGELMLTGNRMLLEFALRALLETIIENRGELGSKELGLQMRSAGAGAELAVLLALKGRSLELEGILPEPVEGGVPNQGRIGVFLAKEILHLHRGEIHAGPGLEGTEILISVCNADAV
jgi:hypothetical protein